MNNDRICSRCNWNDCDYGCTCPSGEEVYQCELYMMYHPDEVKEFDKMCEKFIGGVTHANNSRRPKNV